MILLQKYSHIPGVLEQNFNYFSKLLNQYSSVLSILGKLKLVRISFCIRYQILKSQQSRETMSSTCFLVRSSQNQAFAKSLLIPVNCQRPLLHTGIHTKSCVERIVILYKQHIIHNLSPYLRSASVCEYINQLVYIFPET